MIYVNSWVFECTAFIIANIYSFLFTKYETEHCIMSTNNWIKCEKPILEVLYSIGLCVVRVGVFTLPCDSLPEKQNIISFKYKQTIGESGLVFM